MLKSFSSRYFRFTLLIIALVFLFSYSVKSQDSVQRKVDSVQVIPDTLLFRIQTAQAAITEINAANKKGYDLNPINDRIAVLQSSISSVKRDFATGKSNMESRSLQSYKLILKDVLTELTAISSRLMKYNTELQRMSQQVVELSADSLLQISDQNAQKELYKPQLAQIKLRLQDAGEVTGKSLSKVSGLLATASAMTIAINDLQVGLDEQIEKSGKVAANREVPYLWAAPWTLLGFNEIGMRLSDAFSGQAEILQYFVNSTWDVTIMVLLLIAGFFIWVHRNFRSAQRLSVKRKIGELQFDYLRPYPVMASLIVLLCILPAFLPDAPSVYIELIQMALMIVMTLHLRKVLPSAALRSWLIIVAGFLVLIFSSNLISAGILPRLFLLAIHAIFLYLGIRIYRKIKIQQLPKRFFKLVISVMVFMNGLAIILNIFGRISLAKMFGMTGIISLTQIIGLAVFVQIVLDAMELQLKISSCNKGFLSRVNPQALKSKLKKLLTFTCYLLWIMVLFINLSVTSGVGTVINSILSKERSFGSIHFSLGNILFFVGIIYLSNKLQKHVPVFFGEQRISFDGASDHKGSKVALFRLIIIVIGLLLAFTASGLPMDKLTVVLGALGVGIGLGMQNIVNNFVSGIILIFEKPFRIGDYVELADKKGKVQDIGIRSSKLLTPQGSEVIIPNGDLLSGRLVNWTLSNDYLKSELLLKLSAAADMDLVQKVVGDVIKTSTHSVSNLPPEILINNLGADSVEIKILVWINNVYVEAAFKSDVLLRLMVAFKENEITVV